MDVLGIDDLYLKKLKETSFSKTKNTIQIFYNKKSFYTYAFPYKNIIIDKNTWGNLIAAIRSY